MNRTIRIFAWVAVAGLLAAAASQPPTAPGASAARMRRIYEACRIRQQQSGRFPQELRELEGVLDDETMRQIPKIQFLDPDSHDRLLQRRSPVGERVPCLRMELGAGRYINVSNTGLVFESGLYWECEFVDLMPRPFMNPRLLELDTRSIPERAAKWQGGSESNRVDLVPFCNAIPTAPWFHGPKWKESAEKLSAGGEASAPDFGPWLSSGIFHYKGQVFDVRGVIQVDGKLGPTTNAVRWLRSYPKKVQGIAVHRIARNLHLLAGTIAATTNGTIAALITLRHRSGEISGLPLIYGVHVADASGSTSASERLYPKSMPATLAPSADNVAYSLNYIQLANPRPDDPIETIGFESGPGSTHPYLLALTLEP